MIRLSASSSFRFNHRAWAAIALPVMLASCSTFTGTQHTSVPDLPPMPATFTEASGELPSVNWWVSFNDSTLDALVEKALANNYSLKAASARVEQSLASLRGSRSDYYPTVNAELGKSRRWNEDDTTTSQWSGGLTASYELDLWGSIRANAQIGRASCRERV